MSSSLPFPDFFIVGAQRSGTTSLYEYLGKHPRVFTSPHKETHFFSQDLVQIDTDLVVRSETDYLGLFAGAEGGALLGEASPSYLWHPQAARRIFECQPRAKIIACLREPIGRAFSQYQMDLADGLSPVSFHDLIERDYSRGGQVYGTGHLYIELGMYAEQIKRYLDVFGPEAVLVLAFDELTTYPERVLARVATFLGIEPAGFEQVDLYKIHNRNAMPSNPLARRVLPHRSLRLLYRSLVPLHMRRNLRGRIFDSAVTIEPDADSIAFLRRLYAPGLAELEALCQISFPAFRNGQNA